uniref:(northern house mosquito) hypothetical protein n=1 Tax=Culex pipiens TaxID=7175 RepID=A0A8D8F4R7_CULPI
MGKSSSATLSCPRRGSLRRSASLAIASSLSVRTAASSSTGRWPPPCRTFTPPEMSAVPAGYPPSTGSRCACGRRPARWERWPRGPWRPNEPARRSTRTFASSCSTT